VLWFRDLARCFAPDHPFYGLQARGLDGIQEPFSRIEAMAAYYIDEIRRLQPRGPYFLGGASFGGAVALEMAQQLRQQGEEVALLAIFDQSPPNVKATTNDNPWTSLLKVIRNFPLWLGEFIQLGPSRILMRVRRKLRLANKIRRQSAAPNLEQFEVADFIDFAGELDSHRLQLIRSHFQAMEAYRPNAYHGRVTLFRATTRPLLSTFDPELAWKAITLGSLEVVNVPSSHEGMFRIPHVRYLAAQLKRLIDQASGIR
jgi:thioesterase domain-containing protein